MDILLIVLAVLCLLVGLVGCIVPGLPGPPVAYVGMLFLHATDKIQFTTSQLVVWGLLVVVAQVLDYVVPLLGSKYAGGSKWGSRGCLIGTIVGLFFAPWGIVLGPFLGAVIGELLGDKNLDEALKSGVGSLLGFLLGTVLKIGICGYFIFQSICQIFH